MRTIEATIDEQGKVRLLEPIQVTGKRRVLVTIFEEGEEAVMLRPYGLAYGQFTVPKDFDDPLPDDILATFEGT